MAAAVRSAGRPRQPGWLLRLGVTAGLLVEAVVHWYLAEPFGLAAPGGWGGDPVFRLQATAAAVAALLVLLTGRLAAYAFALLVAGSALAAVLAATWFVTPALGPIPAMHDPVWYPLKTLSAVAEGLTVLLAIAALLPRRRSRGSTPAPVTQRNRQKG